MSITKQVRILLLVSALFALVSLLFGRDEAAGRMLAMIFGMSVVSYLYKEEYEKNG